ncbi:MAG: divergent PAP2 family protein [Bacilli bacterium]
MNDYIYLICPFVTLVICQIIKFITETITTKTINIARLFNGSGGMPSSHTSFSASLMTLIGLRLGFDSVLFAITLIFTFIISYDAMGVRWESGEQAKAINSIYKDLLVAKPKEGFQILKERLGHQPIEVFGGMILGILVGLIFNLYL